MEEVRLMLARAREDREMEALRAMNSELAAMLKATLEALGTVK